MGIKRNQSPILTVRVSSDGTQAVSGSEDQTITFWDLESKEPIKKISGQKETLSAIAITSNLQKVVYSNYWDTTLKIRDLQKGMITNEHRGHTGRINTITISPGGLTAVSGSEDETLRVWDLRIQKDLLTIGLRNLLQNLLDLWRPSSPYLQFLLDHQITSYAVTQDENQVISGSSEGSINIWSIENGKLLKTIKGHEDPIESLIVTTDGEKIISGSGNKNLKAWDFESGNLLHTFNNATGLGHPVVITPDGSRLISNPAGSIMKVWDLESGELLLTLDGGWYGLSSIAITANGNRAIACSASFIPYEALFGDENSDPKDLVQVWDLRKGELILTLAGHQSWVTKVELTPDESKAITSSCDNTIRVWDLDSGNLIHILQGHERDVVDIAISNDGNHLVSGSLDETLKVWDLESGEMLQTIDGHGDAVDIVSFSPDDTKILSASRDKTIKIWDVSSGKHLHTLEGHQHWIDKMEITREGSLILSHGYETIRIWNLEKGEKTTKPNVLENAISNLKRWNIHSQALIYTLKDHTEGLDAIEITPDGSRAVSVCSDQTIKIWDIKKGQILHTIKGIKIWNRAVALSPDGNFILAGLSRNSLGVWDMQTGSLLKRLVLNQKTGFVRALAIAPNGKIAVSFLQEGLEKNSHLVIWDLEKGQDISAQVIDGEITACTMLPDNKTIMAGSTNGKVHFLEIAKNGLNQNKE